ncbi:MAG: ATP-dependent helicase [Methanocellales archaeon]|nr:ATP-dependent helicase [Methanocellales archaeon]
MAIRTAHEYNDEEIYERLEPYIGEWFRRTFGAFTPPQRYAIIEIMRRRNMLVCAPTGTGKTFACFLGIINYLCKLARDAKLEDRIYCLYISPLRALGNDIYRNLELPLAEIAKIAKDMGTEMPSIRVATRTGDTSPREKQRMLHTPPHILITTPETAAIILNAPKFSRHLANLEYVIVDEVHEVADSKRGAHLSLTLERLQHDKDFARIGMSATISPVREVAKFLVGRKNEKLRSCLVADVSHAKPFEIEVVSPVKDLILMDSAEATASMYRCIKDLVDKHRSTLIFTNTRSGAERVSYHLSRLYAGEDVEIGAHHGSLSRETRVGVEEGLKEGRMKAVACSSSLELGIDIGALDLCILVGSPKSITRLIQRVGRSGHEFLAKAKGRLIVLDRDDLVEGAVLARCALERKLDDVQIVGAALDVLAQHIVGMALEKKWGVKEAYDLVKGAYPYRNLSEENFRSILEYLSGSELEGRKVYPKIWYSPSEEVFGRRGRTVRGIYMTHVGTIPSETSIHVYQGRRWIGKIDEPFLERLYKGDVFVLGGKTWVFKHVKGMRAYVEDAFGRSPTIPSWIGEMLPLSFDSAVEIGKFRALMRRKIASQDKIIDWLRGEYHLDKGAAKQIYEYFRQQYSYAGKIPSHERILCEEYFDSLGRQNIIFHALYGRRTLDALSRAYAYKIGREYHTNVAVTVGDNGFILKLPVRKRAELRRVTKILKSEEMEEVLRKTLRRTELLKRRFRHCATRGLMVLRQYKGYEIKMGRQQRSSDVVLSAASKMPNFPIVEETYREILEEVMDIRHAKEVLRGMENGKIKVDLVEGLPVPTPFAHNLIALQAADVVLMESRKEFLRELHRRVLEYIGDLT